MTSAFRRRIRQAAKKAGWADVKPTIYKPTPVMFRAQWWVDASGGIMTSSQVRKSAAIFAVYDLAARILGVKS